MYVIVILCKTKKIHKLKPIILKSLFSHRDEGPPLLFTPPPPLLSSFLAYEKDLERSGSSLSLLPPPFLTYAVLRFANVLTREPLVV